MPRLQKIIVICGPTATGKPDHGVQLAKEINGEIISADSRQVYRGLDIGSGKITKREMCGVPHHLLDVISPKRVFSVAQYKKLATKAIVDIVARGRTPIVVGGTGFYIDAVICDTLFPEVPPNKILRAQLAKKTAAENFKTLLTLDPIRAHAIDPHNNVRLIRAIEIATALGSVPKLNQKNNYEIKWVYLDFADEVLKERIHTRLVKRMRQGMVVEVKQLHENGVSWKRLEALGLEYRFVAQYLQGKLSKENMLVELERAIWHYAKRQRTWFKKYIKK